MKQYVIDELTEESCDRLRQYLDERFGESGVDGLYWLPIPEEELGPEQARHHECKPFCFAAELLPGHIVFELLVRTRNRMHCNCMAHANTRQSIWLMAAMDAIFEQLGIKI